MLIVGAICKDPLPPAFLHVDPLHRDRSERDMEPGRYDFEFSIVNRRFLSTRYRPDLVNLRTREAEQAGLSVCVGRR